MSADLLYLKLQKYKRKFYTNQIIRGTLITAISIGVILLIFSVLEGFFWFSSSIRTFIFITSILSLALIIGTLILWPALALINLVKGISDIQAARNIGIHFPEVGDKLINYLQLAEKADVNTSLLSAALDQRTEELKPINFPKAINFNVNRKFVNYLMLLFASIVLFSFMSPNFFGASAKRILNFNAEFERPVPFQFTLASELVAFKNDSYNFQVKLIGESLPEEVYLLDGERRFKMNYDKGLASFSFPSVSRDRVLQVSAAGYNSKAYQLKVYNRPEIQSLKLDIDYPEYTGLTDQIIINTGSLIIPEGSNIQWNINCADAEKVLFITETDSSTMERIDNQDFMINRTIYSSTDYQLALLNKHAQNKSDIKYKLSVNKDKYPIIDVKFLPDTISFHSIFVSGNINDDYGFRSLKLIYTKTGANNSRSIAIPFDKKQTTQQFYFRWNLDSLNLQSKEHVELYVVVGDNDGVNGSKKAISEKFYLRIPDEQEIEKMISDKSENSQSQIEKSLKKAEDIKERLKDLESRLKNKKELDWQDEKLLEELLAEKDKLNQEIKKLQQKHQELIDSQKEFGKQSEKLQEKAKKLQELINEVMDEETKKMYDELQQLLKEKSNSEQVLDQLSKIQNKENNLEKELERAIELFKRMKLETQLEQTAEKLDKLGDKQEKLGEKQQDKDSDENKIDQEQKEINEDFEEIKKDLEEAKDLNQELNKPESLDNLDEQQQEISEDLEEISEELNEVNDQAKSEEKSSKQTKKEKQQSGQKMKNAGQKMKEMSKAMTAMQSSAEMTMMQENLDDLRDILDNLIKLSFEQETVLTEIQEVQQVDPRFIELSQDQLQLISNAEVIEDSLLALASRVVQISSFVTREVGEVNRHLDEAIFELRERNKGKAASHQQFAMTSMNNLALLLDDVLRQMQMSMAEAMGNPQEGGQKKQSLPSMSEMQKQLSDQIKQLKGSGKSGRELSEELAKLAAEQSELRRQLEQMQEGLEGQPQPGEEGKNGEKGGAGSKLKEAIEKMEENEVDLVNKRITQQLINRQQDILTRMLEAEQSMREQKKSPERQGETASDISRKIPPAIEDYLKARQQEIELLKTIPLDLTPFYKKQVNDYFRRLSVPQQ